MVNLGGVIGHVNGRRRGEERGERTISYIEGISFKVVPVN